MRSASIAIASLVPIDLKRKIFVLRESGLKDEALSLLRESAKDIDRGPYFSDVVMEIIERDVRGRGDAKPEPEEAS